MTSEELPGTTLQRPVSRGLRASLQNLQAFKRNPLDFYASLTFDGGYRTIVEFELFGANYLVNDAEHAGRILTSAIDDGAYTKDGLRFFEVMRRLLHRGLFTSEGDFHLQQRRSLQPTFQPKPVAELAPGLIRVAEELASPWHPLVGQVVDVEQHMRRLSLDLLAEAFAGSDVRAEVHRFGDLNDAMEDRLIETMDTPFLLPAWVPTGKRRRFRKTAAELHAVVSRIVAQRRASAGPDCLLSRLLGSDSASGMSVSQLHDEVLTLLVGGYRSTTSALTWTWYLLARHPEVLARLREELWSVLGERAVEAADLPRLTYTRSVAEESLRLYPPVWVINRAATRPDRLGALSLSRGSIIAISPYTLHRNPSQWERPDDFYPDHFRPGAKRPTHAYLPFGAGRHKCIGNHYALAALVIVLATLARRFGFDAPEREVKANTRAFTVPEGGMPLRLRAGPVRENARA